MMSSDGSETEHRVTDARDRNRSVSQRKVKTAHNSIHHRILLMIPEIDSFEIELVGTHRLRDNERKKKEFAGERWP